LSKKSIALLLLVILTPLIIYFLWPSDESRIKKLFREGSRAIEREDIDSVMSKVSYAYRDEHGMTYLYIKEYTKRFFRQMKDITVEYENLKIDVYNKNATADVDVRIIATIGNNTGYIFGNFDEPIHLRFTLEKERTKWLVTNTEGLPI